MRHEMSEEFVRRHGCGVVAMSAEGHGAFVERDETAIGNANAMRVSAHVREHLLDAAEWRFDIDVPARAVERIAHTRKSLAIGKSRGEPIESELAGLVRHIKRVEELASEQICKDTSGE